MTVKLVLFLKWTIKIENFDIEINENLKKSFIGSLPHILLNGHLKIEQSDIEISENLKNSLIGS